MVEPERSRYKRNAQKCNKTLLRLCSCALFVTCSVWLSTVAVPSSDSAQEKKDAVRESLNIFLKNATDRNKGSDSQLSNDLKEHSVEAFFGFVRVPKSGSTTLLSFLEHESGFRPWNDFLYRASDYVDSTSSQHKRNMMFCVYGDSHGEPRFKHPRDLHDPYHLRDDHYSRHCPHMSAPSLKRAWEQSLPFLPRPSNTKKQRVSLQIFSMVREPFERLCSLFYFVAKYCDTTQAWRDTFTEAQYECICDGDLEGWFRLLHEEKGGIKLGVPYQFHFFDRHVEDAISMVEGDAPEVIVLLNECFEASLRIMESKFSMQPGATDAFLNSSHSNLNVRKTELEDSESHEKLRKAAKTWFADDYKFYEAAVAQFKHQAESTNLEASSLLNPCIHIDSTEDSKGRTHAATYGVVGRQQDLNSKSEEGQEKPSSASSLSSNTTSFLGFIRIPKTGSTTILHFLAYESGLHSYNQFFYSVTDFMDASNHDRELYSPFCVYGKATDAILPHEHDPRDGANPFESSRKTPETHCPHLGAEDLRRYWSRNFRFLHEPARASFDDKDLPLFTMVREPYDRYRSFFFFVKKFCNTTQGWNGYFTASQYELLCAGDFTAWFESLKEENDISDQFEYVDDDVNKAVSLIEGDSPKVLVLLNECFEASMRLLEHKFELKTGATDEFLKSDHAEKNRRKAPVNESESNRKMRDAAKLMLADDYKFYDAAIVQFRRQIKAAKIDPTTLQSPCPYLT